eukprot:gene10865-12860_t
MAEMPLASPVVNLEDIGVVKLEELGEVYNDEYLQYLAGAEELESVSYLEVKVDSSEISPEFLGMVLWIARCEMQDLEGIGSLTTLRELYASFNDIHDLSPLASCENLEVVDVEANKVSDIEVISYLSLNSKLHTLTISGNPFTEQPGYRRHIHAAVKHLQILDDEPIVENDKMEPPPLKDLAADSEVGESEEEQLLAKLKAERDSAQRELNMVSAGIKYAKVGIDDMDVTTDLRGVNSHLEVFAGRPLTASRPGELHFRAQAVREPVADGPLVRQPQEEAQDEGGDEEKRPRSANEEQEELLDSLRKWKVETMDIVLAPADDDFSDEEDLLAPPRAAAVGEMYDMLDLDSGEQEQAYHFVDGPDEPLHYEL